MEQIHVILDTLGEPPAHLMASYYDMHQLFIKRHVIKRRPLREQLPDAPADALHLLELLLEYDSNKRLDVSASLKHKFVAKYHNSSSVYERPCIPAFNFDFEEQKFSKSQLRSAVMDEIMSFHKPKVKPKIPFNFKPVSKSDLAKTQQLKAAALKAKQDQDRETSQPINTSTSSVTKSSTSFIAAGSSFLGALETSLKGDALQQMSSGLDAFLKQLEAKQMVNPCEQSSISSFKTPQCFPAAPSNVQTKTKPHRDAPGDVHMLSASREKSEREANIYKNADRRDSVTSEAGGRNTSSVEKKEEKLSTIEKLRATLQKKQRGGLRDIVTLLYFNFNL